MFNPLQGFIQDFFLLWGGGGDLLPRTRMHTAGLSDWFCPSVSVCVSHQNLGLISTTKGLNTSKRHSNNDKSNKKILHGVPEGG